jgi:HEPN domain-containing protein
MKPPDDVRQELVDRWRRKADEDLGVSRQLAAQGQYLGAAAFHAQRAGEKYLKALLAHRQVEFPKTHDLARLLELVATFDEKLARLLTEVRLLSQYGVKLRYPGDAPEITGAEAAEAVELAGRTRDAAARWLEQPASGPDDSEAKPA